MNAVTMTKDESICLMQKELDRLRECLMQAKQLLQDGVLVRNIADDHDTFAFINSGMRVASFVTKLNACLDLAPVAIENSENE